MWLYVTPRSNNQPNNVAAYFLDVVESIVDAQLISLLIWVLKIEL